MEDPTGIVVATEQGIKVDTSRAQLAVAAFGIGIFLGWMLTASSASKKIGARDAEIKRIASEEAKARGERDKAFYHVGRKEILG